MTKVYVVTQGYYSAYRIVGLFSDKEKAEDLIKLAGGKGDWEEYDLEEYTLDDPYFLEVLKVKLLLWHVTMDKNGDNVYASQQDLPYSLENVGEVNFGILLIIILRKNHLTLNVVILFLSPNICGINQH